MSRADRKSYTYLPPRAANSIRLVELLLALKGSPLHCRLVEVRRNRIIIGYEARSYAWGDAIFIHYLVEVYTNGTIPVTENLYHAFQALRRPMASRSLVVGRCRLY